MNFVIIATYLVMGLIGLGLLAMVLFGIRSVAYGKVNPITMGIISIPVVLLLILGLVMGDWALAGITTIFIMLGLAVLSLLATGIKGLFS